MSYDSILSSSSGLLIIITGIMVSGKTTIARELGKKYSYRVISVDDFKVDLCDKYGFVSEYESKILSDSAEGLFRAEVVEYARSGNSFIVDYTFDTSWQEFFNYIQNRYDYNLIVVNCNSRSFDSIWQSRMGLGLLGSRIGDCLYASKYIKGVLCENGGKLNEIHMLESEKEYKDGVYTSLSGDLVITDADLLG